MVLEKLIDGLMRAAIEHTGADRGLLILPRGDQFLIEAEATSGGNDVKVHQREAPVSAAVLPESVVRYVMRTRHDLILDDATAGNPFSTDAYLVQHRARSIACLPLINQARLTGVIYLENNLTGHAFTSNRITVLKVLASQAAISLENTRLYRDLEDRERRIQRLVDANILGIFIWNLEGAIVDANEAFLHMLQYGREDVASGRVRWTDLTPPKWRERDERVLAELKATGMVRPYEKEYLRKDGSRVPVLVGGALFEESGGDGVAFALDLSEQKHAEEALRRSEADLAEAQKLSRTGSWHWNIDTGEVSWSQEFFAIVGFDSEKDEASYQLYLERIHPEDRSKVEETRWAAIRERQHFEAEYRLMLPGGVIKYLHSTGHCLVDQSGDVEFIGAVMDITERKRAEEERERLRQAQRVVVETANDAMVSADESGAIQFANSATMRIFGYDPEELIGKPLTVLMPEYMRKLHENGFRRYLATGRRHINWHGSELTGLRKNGQEFPVEVSFGELTMNGHKVFTGFIRDITARKQVEEERERLRQVQADLAHVTRVSTMGELTASLAHEIKQPIGAAVTNAEACLRLIDRRNPDLPEAREAALEMIKDARRAADIIDRVRLLYQKGASQLETVDLNQVIEEMVIMMGAEANRHAVTIHTDLTPELPKVMADRVQLQQALMNLMLNGIEAMQDTGGELRIKSLSAAEGQLLISVSDTGVGLPIGNLDKIFNAFFTTKTQGTGLGLAITRSVIQSHGGDIWATANSGGGTTFHFTLPIREAAIA